MRYLSELLLFSVWQHNMKKNVNENLKAFAVLIVFQRTIFYIFSIKEQMWRSLMRVLEEQSQ